MPRYRNKPSKPASGEESGMALDSPKPQSSASNFGPNSIAERNALTRKGPQGFRSSQSNPVPATHVEPQFQPKQEV